MRRRDGRGAGARSGLPTAVSLLLLLAAAGVLLTACGGRVPTAAGSPGAAVTSPSGPEAAVTLAATPPAARVAPPGAASAGTVAFVKGAVGADGDVEAKGIYSVRGDGSGLTRLVDSPSARNPAWSPDGSRIAYIDDSVVHVVRADGSCVQHVWPNADGHAAGDGALAVAWSPDGTRIAFVASGWVQSLYVTRVDRPREVRLCYGGFEDRYPAWGPQGRIFFVHRQPGPDRICSVRPDGTGFVALKRMSAHSSFCLSPNGDWLLVWDSARDQFLRVPASGAPAGKRLALDDVRKRTGVLGIDAFAPSVARDGAIVFASDRGSDEPPSALYVVSAGSERLRRIPGAGLGWDPVWRPE